MHPHEPLTLVPSNSKSDTGTIVTPDALPLITPAASRALMTLLRSAETRRLARDAAMVAS